MENYVTGVISTFEIKKKIDSASLSEVSDSLKRILIFISSLLAHKLDSFKNIEDRIQRDFEDFSEGRISDKEASVNISGLGCLYNELASEIKNYCQILGKEFKELNIGEEPLWNSFQELIDTTQEAVKALNEISSSVVTIKREEEA